MTGTARHRSHEVARLRSGITPLTTFVDAVFKPCLFIILIMTNVWADHLITPKDNFNYFILGDFYSIEKSQSWCINTYINEGTIGEGGYTTLEYCEPDQPGGDWPFNTCDFTPSSHAALSRCHTTFYCKDENGDFTGQIPQPTQNNPYCEGAVDPDKNMAECPFCPRPEAGNPIGIGIGNKYQIETDYQSPAPGGITYRRYYNSLGEGRRRRHGAGWSADYAQTMTYFPDADMLQVFRPDGKKYRFRKQAGNWLADADVPMQLAPITDTQGEITGWLLTLEDDTVEEYDMPSLTSIRPIKFTTRDGFITTLEYDVPLAEGGSGDGALDRVTDHFGRILSFHYTGTKLSKLIDPDGHEILYEHDANENITKTIFPDGNANPNDNPSRIFHYEDPNYPNHLTGITDENGNRLSTYAYDSEGRAVLSERAGSTEVVNAVYNTDGSVTVTDGLGLEQTFQFRTQHGLVKVASIEEKPCPTCSTRIQSVTYDANGYVASRTDFNGNVTTFINNARGLETSRTEAVGTPEERTIITEWHPTFRLPTKITQPGKETTFTYDTQGRLLERTEEVTP